MYMELCLGNQAAESEIKNLNLNLNLNHEIHTYPPGVSFLTSTRGPTIHLGS